MVRKKKGKKGVFAKKKKNTSANQNHNVDRSKEAKTANSIISGNSAKLGEPKQKTRKSLAHKGREEKEKRENLHT